MLKTLEIRIGAFTLRHRRLDEGGNQWWKSIWDKTIRLRIYHKKVFGKILSVFYKQLQAIKPKVSYSIESYFW